MVMDDEDQQKKKKKQEAVNDSHISREQYSGNI